MKHISFYLIFLISIISPEMLVTNWKLVTGMIGNQLKPLKNHRIALRICIKTFKSDSEAYKCFFLISIISPEMLVTNWKLVTGMMGESTKPLKNHRIALRNALQPLKSDSETYKCFIWFSSFRSYLLKC